MAERCLESQFIRRGGAALLLLPALFFATIWFVASAGKDMLDHTIQHSRQLEVEFKEAARFVDAFREDRGRFPNSDETERHLGRSGPFLIQAGGGFFQDAVAAVGLPPDGGYVLGIWRGEWMEYYASWSGATTMSFDESAYYLFGSRAADCFIGALGLIFCLAGSVRLWRSAGRD